MDLQFELILTIPITEETTGLSKQRRSILYKIHNLSIVTCDLSSDILHILSKGANSVINYLLGLIAVNSLVPKGLHIKVSFILIGYI